MEEFAFGEVEPVFVNGDAGTVALFLAQEDEDERLAIKDVLGEAADVHAGDVVADLQRMAFGSDPDVALMGELLLHVGDFPAGVGAVFEFRLYGGIGFADGFGGSGGVLRAGGTGEQGGEEEGEREGFHGFG